MPEKGEQFEPKPSREAPQENLLRREEEILQKLQRGEHKSLDEEYVRFKEEFKKEILNRGALIFIYRDNNLFRRYMPIATKIITEMGHKISVYAFPEGTSEEEIENWLEKNKNSIYQENLFITDDTVYFAASNLPKSEKSKFVHRHISLGLDKIIRQAFLRILFKSEEKLLQEMLSKEAKSAMHDFYGKEENRIIFTSIVKSILRNPENVPEKVIIFTSNLSDHVTDLGLKELGGKLLEAQRQEDEKLKLEMYTQIDETIANMIKDWLIECGIEPSKIEIVKTGDLSKYSEVPYSERLKIIKGVDKPNVWVIADRHIRISSDYGPYTMAKLFGMPVGSFVDDAMKAYHMFSFSEEEIESALRETLKERL